jgi:hypothetical protein
VDENDAGAGSGNNSDGGYNYGGWDDHYDGNDIGGGGNADPDESTTFSVLSPSAPSTSVIMESLSQSANVRTLPLIAAMRPQSHIHQESYSQVPFDEAQGSSSPVGVVNTTPSYLRELDAQILSGEPQESTESNPVAGLHGPVFEEPQDG